MLKKARQGALWQGGAGGQRAICGIAQADRTGSVAALVGVLVSPIPSCRLECCTAVWEGNDYVKNLRYCMIKAGVRKMLLVKKDEYDTDKMLTICAEC